jgi:hypothetical protein
MAEHRVPPVVERAIEDLQDVGLSPSFVERFVSWWKRFGLRKAVIFGLAVTLPLWRYVWIPHSVSVGLSTLAESYGAELEVEDWSSDWGNIRVVGEDVILHARGAYSNQKLLEASGIELDWSLLRSVGDMYERFKSLVLFRDPPPEEPVQALRFQRATLHMERLLSGRWNWQDAIESDRVDWNKLSRFRIPAIDADQLRLEWVEHVPANSGGGLIEQTTASLFLDDVRLRFTDLMLPQDARVNAASFSIEGRTADGRFSAAGGLNLARWGTQDYRLASFSDNGASWAPTFNVSIYLENVGAGALQRIVSDASLFPTSGTMTGKILLAVNDEGVLNCDIDLQLRNVQIAPNPRSPFIRPRRDEIERELSGALINHHIKHQCQAPWKEPGFRVAKALQAEITGEAVQDLSPMVQGAAGYDRLRFVEANQAADAVLNQLTTDLTAKIGAALGGERGAAVAQALAPSDAPGGNPVTRGMKNVGRGFKRLFGGGDDKKKK